jgi:hypothetical protein
MCSKYVILTDVLNRLTKINTLSNFFLNPHLKIGHILNSRASDIQSNIVLLSMWSEMFMVHNIIFQHPVALGHQFLWTKCRVQ